MVLTFSDFYNYHYDVDDGDDESFGSGGNDHMRKNYTVANLSQQPIILLNLILLIQHISTYFIQCQLNFRVICVSVYNAD